MDDQQPREIDEAIELAAPDTSSTRTRRARVIAVAAAVTVLAGFTGAVALATSDDDPATINATPTVTGSATGADVSTTAVATTTPGPSIGARPSSSGPDFQNVTELMRATLASGEIVRFVETNDRRYLCSVVGTLPGPGTQCINVGSMPPQSGGPRIVSPFGSSANGAVYLGFLPTGFANDFTIRDDAGAPIPFGRSSDGTAFILLDTVQPSAPAPNRPPATRTFELVDRNGAVLARLSAPASLPPALPPTSPPSQLAACLRSKGLDVPDPSPGRPMTAYPPDVARVAWEGCRDLYVKTSNIPASVVAQALAYPDCMAAQGWLVAIGGGPPAGTAGYNSAHQKCDPRFQLVNCLRSNGLDVADPPTNSPSMTSVPAYPTEAARAAWQNCRDTYARLNSIPEERVALVLALADCMAGNGWIIVMGPPADKVQHDAALQRCDKALMDSVAGSFASSDITVAEAQCIGDRLVASLGAASVVDHNLARGGWSLLGVALSTDWARADAEKTVDAFAACAPNWKLLLIKTATEGTDRMSDTSAKCVANDLTDRDGRTIFIEELDRADPSLSYLKPLLASFDKCLTPAELDRIDWD